MFPDDDIKSNVNGGAQLSLMTGTGERFNDSKPIKRDPLISCEGTDTLEMINEHRITTPPPLTDTTTHSNPETSSMATQVRNRMASIPKFEISQTERGEGEEKQR